MDGRMGGSSSEPKSSPHVLVPKNRSDVLNSRCRLLFQPEKQTDIFIDEMVPLFLHPFLHLLHDIVLLYANPTSLITNITTTPEN